MNVAEPHPANELVSRISQQRAGGSIGVDDTIPLRIDGKRGVGDLTKKKFVLGLVIGGLGFRLLQPRDPPVLPWNITGVAVSCTHGRGIVPGHADGPPATSRRCESD